MRKSKFERIVLVCILPLVSPAASAVDLGLAAELGYGNSDNLARTGTNEISEDIATVGVDLAVVENSQNLTVDIRARALRFDYREGTFDDETLASVDALLLYSTTNNVFSWLVQNNYGQQIIDVFQPITPINRENVNIFRTGPNLRVPLGQRNSLDLGLSYEDTNYEIRDQDNSRKSATLQFVRQSSQTQNYALVASRERIEYDDQILNSDLDLTRLFVRYELANPRTTLSLDLGWNEIESDLTTGDGLFSELNLSRQTSPFGTFNIQAGSQYSESGNIFSQFQQFANRGVAVFGDDSTADIENTSDPFLLTFAAIGYAVERERSDWGLSVSYQDEDYEVQTNLNRKSVSYAANIGRMVSPRFRLFAFGDFTDRDFEARLRRDEDTSFGAGIEWSIGRRSSLTFSVDHFDRSSNLPLAEFTELRYFLTFRYQLLELAAGQ